MIWLIFFFFKGFVTLYARSVERHLLYRLWDLILLDGWKMIFRLALAFTFKLRPHLIKMVKKEKMPCSHFQLITVFKSL